MLQQEQKQNEELVNVLQQQQAQLQQQQENVPSNQIGIDPAQMAQKDERIQVLEQALKENAELMQQREIAWQQQKEALAQGGGANNQAAAAAEQKLANSQKRLSELQASYEQCCDELQMLSEHFDERDKEFTRLMAEKQNQEMNLIDTKESALLAQMSEKDAHMALMEMSGAKGPRADAEAKQLRTEKEKIVKELQELSTKRSALEKQIKAGAGSGRTAHQARK